MTTNQKWRKANPEKYKAHWTVREMVLKGKLKSQPCEVCGRTKTHAHHDDYNKPREVRWLCPLCHKAYHKSILPPPKHPKTYVKKPKEELIGVKKYKLQSKAAELRKSGMSYLQIAKELNISSGTAYKWLNIVSYH